MLAALPLARRLPAFAAMTRWVLILCLCSPVATPVAHAGGLGLPGQGTRALGRGGAFHARADDALALQYNPAALADLPVAEILLNGSVVFMDACFRREGTYGDNLLVPNDVSRFGNAADYGSEAFPEVCNEGPPQVVPTVIGAVPLMPERVGVALGVLTELAHGSASWEGEDHAVAGVNGGRRPSPVRYQMIRPNSMIFSLSAGAGLRLAPELAIGGAFHWGIADVNSEAYAALVGAEDPSKDVYTVLDAQDHFVPGATLSVQVTPAPELEITLGGYYSDTLRPKGSATLVYGAFAPAEPVPGASLRTETHIDDIALQSPMPPRVWLGTRYAARRSGVPGRVGRDPLRDELWDVELDIGYEFNSVLDQQVVEFPDGAEITTRAVDVNGEQFEARAGVADRAFIKRFRDQLTLRLGGDVNVLPDQLAVRAGASFETNGLDPRYVSVDFVPGQRLGLHGGATLRAVGFDLSVAYAHFYQWDVENDAIGSGSERAASWAQPVSVGEGKVVNHGRLRVSWDVLSLGAAYRF